MNHHPAVARVKRPPSERAGWGDSESDRGIPQSSTRLRRHLGRSPNQCAGKREQAQAATHKTKHHRRKRGSWHFGGASRRPAPVKRVSRAKEIAERPFSMQAAIAITAAAGPTQDVDAGATTKSAAEPESESGAVALAKLWEVALIRAMPGRDWLWSENPGVRFAGPGGFANDPGLLRELVPATHRETAIPPAGHRRSNGRG